MPAKTMMYKFLNTFIDDLFAFTIKMPILHRLATLRDDVIFFVYLYQAWKYKVDYTRVNEFGQGGDDDGAVQEKREQVAKAEVVEEVKANGVAGAVSSGKDEGSARKRKG
jgi:hypothetical protein